MTRKKKEIEQGAPAHQDDVLHEGEMTVAPEAIAASNEHDSIGILSDSSDKPLLLSDADGTGLLDESSEENGSGAPLQGDDEVNPPADTDQTEDSIAEEQPADADGAGFTENSGVDSPEDTEDLPQEREGVDPPADTAPVEDSETEENAAAAEQVGDDTQSEENAHLPLADAAETSDEKDGSVTEPDGKTAEDEPKPRRRTTSKKKAEDVPEDAGDSNDPPAAVEAPKPARKKRAAPKVAEAPAPTVRRPSAGVLTIESRAEVETPEDKEELVWHEMQNALRTRRILSGTLGGIETTENHNIIAVIYYKDLRVVIPVSEMMIQLSTEPNNYGEMAERQNKILNNMLGCEVDFVVRGIDARTRSVVASRREAMLRKRKTFYLQPDLNGQCQIHEGRVVQARVIAVANKVVRVEVFGVETSILARDLSWEWIGDAHERYMVGDEILIRIRKVNLESPEQISIEADVRSVTENTVQANLKKCKVQGKYAGTVTDIHKGVVFIRLAIGVNAIAHACYDNRMPAKSDDVSFAVTHIDEDRGVAVGIITRIIKQRI